MKQRLTVICGWPMSGKTTVARGLKHALGDHWIDADDVWVLFFGQPNPNPVTEEERAKDGQEVRRTYQLLIAGAGLHLELGRSLIISAPFSRTVGWSDLTEMMKGIPDVEVKVIWCKPSSDNETEIAQRLSLRQFGVNCWSSVNTSDRYLSGRGKFETPAIPHLMLDTSLPFTEGDSVSQALAYIKS